MNTTDRSFPPLHVVARGDDPLDDRTGPSPADVAAAAAAAIEWARLRRERRSVREEAPLSPSLASAPPIAPAVAQVPVHIALPTAARDEAANQPAIEVVSVPAEADFESESKQRSSRMRAVSETVASTGAAVADAAGRAMDSIAVGFARVQREVNVAGVGGRLLPYARKSAATLAVGSAMIAVLLTIGSTVRASWVRTVSALPRAAKRVRLAAAAAATAEPSPRSSPPKVVAPTAARSGAIEVRTDPPGAHVSVDGRERGVSPLVIEQVGAGSHELTLEAADGVVRRTVVVRAGETRDVFEAIYAGWVALFAPFDLQVTENGRRVHLDERGRAMLPPGPHELHLDSAPLDYHEIRRLDLKPGAVLSLSVAPPPSRLTVTAASVAEVWIDGQRVGDTPLEDLPIDLGIRDVLVKADGRQRRYSLTVTPHPIRLDVVF